jgi:Rad3-related DNA helicase
MAQEWLRVEGGCQLTFLSYIEKVVKYFAEILSPKLVLLYQCQSKSAKRLAQFRKAENSCTTCTSKYHKNTKKTKPLLYKF